jgi:hypothetical protein
MLMCMFMFMFMIYSLLSKYKSLWHEWYPELNFQYKPIYVFYNLECLFHARNVIS